MPEQSRPEPADEARQTGAGNTGRPVHPITQETLDRLNKETVYDSLANLLAGSEFDFPATASMHNGFELVVPRKPGDEREQDDWIAVLSNRRVVKLLQELGQLPKEHAGELLSGQMKHNLNLYKQLRAERDAATSLSSDGQIRPGFIWGPFTATRPGDEPDLLATRLSVTASVFIAGALGLTSASDAVSDVTRLALEQRDYCYSISDQQEFEQANAVVNMQFVGFYNPSVLATGIVGTGMIDEDTFNEIASPYFHWIEEDVTDWRSPESVYDAMRDHFALDFSLGRVTVGHAINISDEQFDRICEAAGILK
jgi:hypothetical protein